MIEEWYKNPKKAAVMQQRVTSFGNADWEKAQRLGISVFEYKKRCDIVQEKMQKFFYHLGQVVYPTSVDWFKKLGKCKVVAICRHYDTYGDTKWDDTFPFLVQVQSVENPDTVMDCSIEWISTNPPVETPVC